jgi:hypothetical protein
VDARPTRWLAVAALALCATTPIVGSAVHVGRGWVPVSDTAIVATRARDVFTGETPLLGQPSTAGIDVGEDVHHPGPLEFWAIAAAQQAEDHPAASLVAVTVVNLAAVVLAVLMASWIGGMPLAAWASAVCTALGWSLRGEVLVDPLNPFAALLPFAAFLVACVAVTGRRWWALVPAVVLGSYAAQAHLTTAGMVALAVLGTAIGLIASRGPGGRGWRRPAAAAAASALLCWSAPLLDVVTNGGGNLAALAATGGARDAADGALRRSFDKTVNAVAPLPVWARSGADIPSLLARPSGVGVVSGAILVGGAMALAFVGRRRRDGDSPVAGAASIALALVVGGTFLFARFPTAFFNVFALGNYLWLWPASALLWSVVVAGGASVLGLDRRIGIVPAIVAVALAGASVADPSSRPVDRGTPTAVRSLSSQLASTLDRDTTYLFDLSVEFDEQAVDTGVVHELVRRGFDVRVTPFFEPSYDWRADRASVEGVLRVRVDRERPTGEGAEVATFVPSPAASARLARAERAVVARLEASGGLDEDLFPAFGKPVPPSVEAFVEGDFLTMAATGFLGETARWPETRALEAARRQPVLRSTVFLRPAAVQAAWTATPAPRETTVAAAGVTCSTTVGYTCQWTR